MRGALRRLGFGLATLLGLKRLGFFTPYRYAADARPAGYPALEPLFAAAEPAFADVLAAIEAHGPDLLAIDGGPERARFDQDWFPRLDAAAAYGLVRRERPGRIIEIGSGHSTRFLARAVRDGGLPTEIVAIDPAPRAGLPDEVRHLPGLLQEAEPALFGRLGPGDMLFVDSSHVAMPGTDLDRLVGEVLPRLAPGVLLHVHDIVLPDPYPAEWEWRGYNESLVVAALIGRGGFDLVFSSHWVATRRPERLAEGVLAGIALKPGARETSLWLRAR